MPELQTHLINTGATWQCLAGFRIRRILSAELFLEMANSGQPASMSGVPGRCRDRWIDLAGTLAVLPDPAEFYLVFACNPTGARALPVFDNGLLAVGRGRTQAAAQTDCLRAASDLHKLFSAILDYVEFEPVTEPGGLDGLTGPLTAGCVTEMRRRQALVHVGSGRLVREPVRGFADPPNLRSGNDASALEISHLFPWVPSDDSWWRLIDVMAKEDGPAALIIHARGWPTAPKSCRETAYGDLTGVARAVKLLGEADDQMHVMQMKAVTLHQEALSRLMALDGPMIGARVFLSSSQKVSAALLSVVESSVDDPSVGRDQPGGLLQFRGGADVLKSSSADLLSSPDSPTLDELFSPRESPSVLRTPMPTDSEFPGFPLNRARTAPMLGGGEGNDCPLGLNVHRGLRRNVTMDAASRYRHCYIIGQTGTGKSTLLLHKILHDIGQGRGVAVLDPHGSLMEDILLRFPPERADDLMIVDMTDFEHPVGFNPLYFLEKDPAAYRRGRDLIIDELYGYLDRVYDMKTAGGPIFETHFRGMLGLLMGLECPQPPLVPNLLAFRMLYTNEALRNRMAARIKGQDSLLEEFVKEALASQGEASLKNIAPYVTSKFSRFISDLNLRNIICQSRTLDFDTIVNESKVLLFHLGKSRIGDYAAGLLASQVVSRVQQAVIKRGRSGASTPFHLYADEFQLVASARFAELLAEGRKFGLSVTMAHQFASQIPPEVLRAVIGNVGTTILFRIGAADSEFFAPLFSPTIGQRDLVSLPNYRAYVRGTGGLGAGVFNVDVPGPSEKIDAAQAESLRSLVRTRLGRPRAEVEAEIVTTLDAFRSLENVPP